ncbi:antibiotic biosynthesis monooxygenase [Comamonas nitrativorans]|uniref:Antibiotic biosynthesis monooxygenase n=1 Tax=Comamonas nitrativorans TaxID=108437 RepID=A0ABV9GYG3_9BURK
MDNASRIPSPARAAAPPRAVTVLIARRVRPAAVAAFEAAMLGMLAAAEGFPGHLGGQLVPPQEAGDAAEPLLYHVVFAFDNEAHLAAWQDSAERAQWLQQVLPHTVGTQQLHRVAGLDYWFAAPDSTTRAAPPRWKVAVVTWLGIFPTVLLLFLTVAPLLADWPLVPRVLVITLLVVVIMTWGVAPRLTRWLHPWLHARAG